MSVNKPYRDNVGMVVFNRAGLVLAGDRIQYPGSFQFPQGGMDADETPLAAALRELYEETGLQLSQPTAEVADWLTYEFPEDIPAHLKRYRGQRQKWFFFEWDGDPSALNLDTHVREFRSMRWMQLDDLIHQIVPFKAETYHRIGEEARRLLPEIFQKPAGEDTTEGKPADAMLASASQTPPQERSIVASLEGFSISVGSVSLAEDVDLQIRRGEILGLIGESGCGKTISALALTGMLPEPGGSATGHAWFNGTEIFSMPADSLRSLRGSRIGVIFQEPASALNPLLTIGQQLREVFEFHRERAASLRLEQEERITSLLRRVGFPEPEHILRSYPHELSGGMLQRIIIVLALLLKPDLIIADEPTTALDVTVQAQIMQLLVELKEEEDCAILLITHNMGLVAQYADRLIVMYAGRVVESSPVDVFLSRPVHPYSQGLLAAIPDLKKHGPLRSIPGQVPSPKDYEPGCRFRNRCPRAIAQCIRRPAMVTIAPAHSAACWLAGR